MSRKPEYTVTTASPATPEVEEDGTAVATFAIAAHAYGEACRKWPHHTVRVRKDGKVMLRSLPLWHRGSWPHDDPRE
jgi:hypothetical protein